MHHCFNCDKELGPLARSEWQPGDTCGSIECDRATRNAIPNEHDDNKLDREIDERKKEIVKAMSITYGDYLIDCGHFDITPEQEREIEAREECARRDIDPDEICADGGVTAWMVVDRERRP